MSKIFSMITESTDINVVICYTFTLCEETLHSSKLLLQTPNTEFNGITKLNNLEFTLDLDSDVHELEVNLINKTN